MLIDGKKLAEVVRNEVKQGAGAFTAKHGRQPGLVVLMVGDDPASEVYTRNKEKAAKEVGIAGSLERLPAATTQEVLLKRIAELNADDAVDGILVQLPLPKHIDEHVVLESLDPKKDVDGFHPVNAGLLASGRPNLVPCTPLGSMFLLRSLTQGGEKFSLAGKHAVVVGRSNIVGKPIAQLLLAENATVTIAHSKTKDLAAVCREADILVVAVGKPELVKKDFVKPGAVVIDVGINRVPGAEGKTRLVGDVATAEVAEIASAITPVPGGVGPMTIACLLENTVRAANLRIAGVR